MTRATPPIAPDWYVPRRGRPVPRWVLAVSAERVLYSRGGDRHYECLRATFLRWVRSSEAQREGVA